MSVEELDSEAIDPKPGAGDLAAGPPSAGPDLGPRSVTYPYRRIERPRPTAAEGPDPYGSPDPEWLRIDWRPHLRRIELDGTEVTYAEIGSGPPILFIHGLGGCWQNWLENLPHFAALGYRAIALDLPGFGSSPMPGWEITMPAYGRLVESFAAALELTGATLVGNSMGGFIAAEVASGAPPWSERLVLVSAAGISHATMRREPAQVAAQVLAITAPLALRFNVAALRRPRIRERAFGGVIRHPLQLRPELLYEFFVSSMGSEGFGPAMVSLTGYDFLDRLAEVGDPTLLVWGRDDLVVPASDAPGYESRIAGSELHIFDDCGHVPMAERPTRFNRLLAGFIERSDG